MSAVQNAPSVRKDRRAAGQEEGRAQGMSLCFAKHQGAEKLAVSSSQSLVFLDSVLRSSNLWASATEPPGHAAHLVVITGGQPILQSP